MNKRKKLLLVLLTLGMCSINVNAQTTNDEVKSDSTSHTTVTNKNGNKSTAKADEQSCDSVQVLEWRQCTQCWGSGGCPNCKMYGRKYDGTSLTQCSTCLGSGRCRQCYGKGGDHYYVWKLKSEVTQQK